MTFAPAGTSTFSPPRTTCLMSPFATTTLPTNGFCPGWWMVPPLSTYVPFGNSGMGANFAGCGPGSAFATGAGENVGACWKYTSPSTSVISQRE